MALPYVTKHSTDGVAVIILSISECAAGKGASEGKKPLKEIWSNVDIKMGNRGEVGETCPHVKMLLDRIVLCTNAHFASLCHRLDELTDGNYWKVLDILI